MSVYKLAVLASHPVPYQSAIFRALHAHPGVDLTVYFSSSFGVGSSNFDREFGAEIDWGRDALEGFKAIFLKNIAFNPRPSFWGQINPGIVQEIGSGSYDAIWVNGWNSVTNWLAFVAAIAFRTQIILRGENPLNQERAKRGLKQRIKRVVLRMLFRRMDAFLYIGEENRKFYLSYGADPEKFFFTPYAVDNRRFTAAFNEREPKRDTLRERIGLSSQDVIFLFVGKLVEKKRPQDLLDAYVEANVRSKKLVFVGEGALRKGLQERVKSQKIEGVVFAGFQPPASLLDYYALADALVLPSGVGETWGLVVNEAMCSGLAVVISDLVGCGPDLVRPGENGAIVSYGDVKALASALETIGSSPGRLRKAKIKSREIVAEYNVDKDVEGILLALAFLGAKTKSK